MNNHMMSVDEARNLIKVLESATAGAIELWDFEEKQLSAARTIVAQDETMQTLSRLLAEAEEAAIERAAQIERVRDAYNHAHTLITEALEGDTE